MRSAAARRPSSAPRWEGPRDGPGNRPQFRFIRQNGKGGRPRVVMRPAPFGVLCVYGGARFIVMPQLGRFRR